MPSIGLHEMVINDISFREASTGSPGVVIGGTIGEEDVFPVIWITEASAGIARRKLKLCGFNCDDYEDPMGHLAANPTMLRGQKVKVLVEMGDRGIQVDILANTPPSAEKLKAASGFLKDVKKSAPTPTQDVSGIPF